MFELILIVAVVCYWLHCQIRRELVARLISSAILCAVAWLVCMYAGGIMSLQRQGSMLTILQNLSSTRDGEEKRELNSLIRGCMDIPGEGQKMQYLTDRTNKIRLKYARSNEPYAPNQ